MLKTISAALLSVAVLVAPAMAAGAKTQAIPAAKSVQVKPGVLNANAKMGRHHHKHYRHHRTHKRMGVVHTHHFSKATIKHAAPTAKRG